MAEPADYRLRALELSIGSSEHPVTTDGIVERAHHFAAFITETDDKVHLPAGYPLRWSNDAYRAATISPFIVTIVGKLDGVVISPTDSEYLIQCIRSRTR